MRFRELQPEERLIVVADMPPPGRPVSKLTLKTQVLNLAAELKDTGVYLLVGPALRACGYGLIWKIRRFGLKVVADLSLYGNKERLEADARAIDEYSPDMVTVSCTAEMEAIRSFKEMLAPSVEVAGVVASDALGHMSDDEVERMLVARAIQAKLSSVFVSYRQVRMVRRKHAMRDFYINATGIGVPESALGAGATRLVVEPPDNLSYARDPLIFMVRNIEKTLDQMRVSA